MDKKADAVEKREAECTARAAEVQKKEKRVEELEQKGVQELERVSGLTSEQAKEELLKSVEDDVKVDVAKTLQRTGRQSKGRSRKESQGICGKCHSEVCSGSCIRDYYFCGTASK